MSMSILGHKTPLSLSYVPQNTSTSAVNYPIPPISATIIGAAIFGSTLMLMGVG